MLSCQTVVSMKLLIQIYSPIVSKDSLRLSAPMASCMTSPPLIGSVVAFLDFNEAHMTPYYVLFDTRVWWFALNQHNYYNMRGGVTVEKCGDVGASFSFGYFLTARAKARAIKPIPSPPPIQRPISRPAEAMPSPFPSPWPIFRPAEAMPEPATPDHETVPGDDDEVPGR